MKNIGNIIAVIFFFLFASRAQSEECCIQKPEKNLFCGGFFTGIVLNQTQITDNLLVAGFIGEKVLFDVAANYRDLDLSRRKNFSNRNNYSRNFTLLTHLGGRNRLHQNLFATYGLKGQCATQATPLLRWSAAFFLGLDLQITRHFLLSTKIDPFCYIHSHLGSRFYQSFGTGSIMSAYVF